MPPSSGSVCTVNIWTPPSGRTSARDAWTGPPDSVSTVSAYAPLNPAGGFGVTAIVVPALTVYVSTAASPPPLPADVVTFTLAVAPGAARESVEPLARLSVTLARAPTGPVAGM